MCSKMLFMGAGIRKVLAASHILLFIVIIITIITTTFTMHHSISVPLQTQYLAFP